ncbi:MAG: serine/threonine protein kinase [Ilumatobacteraceae bacterium]|nr:serine/threonine protein kinase [Ilumatobacteraceae bacterium]
MDESTSAGPAGGVPPELGDYAVLRPFSEGGHGRFYLATPPARLGLQDAVVIKVVAGTQEAGFRRFTRELKLFARVHSPHLVTLYDAGQAEDVFFYSMEWCQGGTLAAPTTELSRPAKLRAVADAARAAHDLHEAGIAHRDLRPGNVLLRADGSACLGDLGLAQFGSGSVTSMAPMASIGFVDPKLITGDSASRASDIYSLGAMLHWVLTGKHIHPGVEGVDPMMAVRSVLREPPHVDRDLLSPGEADIVLACTSPNIEQRPRTALEVATMIDSLSTPADPT